MLLSFPLSPFTLNLYFHEKRIWLYGPLGRSCYVRTGGEKYRSIQYTSKGHFKRSLRYQLNWQWNPAGSLCSKSCTYTLNGIVNCCTFMVYWEREKNLKKYSRTSYPNLWHTKTTPQPLDTECGRPLPVCYKISDWQSPYSQTATLAALHIENIYNRTDANTSFMRKTKTNSYLSSKYRYNS